MPFDNLPHADLAERYGFVPQNHSHQQLYGAELRPVFDERGEPVPDYQRIVRLDSDGQPVRTLEVVGKTYTFIENRVIFGAFEDAINESGLDTRDLMVSTDFGGPNLTRCFRQYVFPAHEVEIRPGVSTALRLLMWNSYDGSLKFSGRAGLFTWVCANTAVVGKVVGNFAIKHSGELHTRSAIKGLVDAAEFHVESGRRLKEWPRIGVSEAQGLELLNALPKASKAQVDHLVHAYARARLDDGPQGGANLWALFATLSAWATHGDAASGGMATREAKQGGLSMASRNQREEQIAALIECEEWSEIEAAG